ncbi:MAG: hypothetical protein PF590_04630 [Candidatus Delongbacteria bacterium]|jgi:hypothetical protein|nr:hypothetical protein [Candidatus Delongbacteria bacterium]
MKVNNALKHWENLGNILKTLEKQKSHKLDIDAAFHEVRNIYTCLLEADEAQNTDTQNDTRSDDIDSSEFIQSGARQEKIQKETSSTAKPTVSEKEKPVPASADAGKKEKQPSKPTPVKSNHSEQSSLFQTEASFSKTGKSLGEKLGANRTAVNETLSNKSSQDDVASKLKSKPVTDIKAAIGLGDRFLFIKELFEGNADEFNKCIHDLNNMNNIEETKSYIEKYKWDLEKDTAKYFWSIVQRRFLSA